MSGDERNRVQVTKYFYSSRKEMGGIEGQVSKYFIKLRLKNTKNFLPGLAVLSLWRDKTSLRLFDYPRSVRRHTTHLHKIQKPSVLKGGFLYFVEMGVIETPSENGRSYESTVCRLPFDLNE